MMKTDGRQTSIFIGLALIVVAVILIIYAISLPRVYVKETAEETVTVSAAVTQAAAAEAEELTVVYPLDINTATMEELMTIDGIGASKAGAIIEYREYLGGYTSVEQITQIKGFGDGFYEQVAPYLTVE